MAAKFPAIPLTGADWQRRATQAVNHLLNPPFPVVTYSGSIPDYADLLLVDANAAPVTVTLPAATNSKNRLLSVKKIDGSANAVTIDGNASETIDGATTQTLAIQWESLLIACDGTAWYVI